MRNLHKIQQNNHNVTDITQSPQPTQSETVSDSQNLRSAKLEANNSSEIKKPAWRAQSRYSKHKLNKLDL